MTALITPPFPSFFDNDGNPLEDGNIYIGVAGSIAPASNPVAVFFDRALTIPAEQPLRTSGGVIVNNGSPAAVYTSTDFSIQVCDANNVVQFFAANYTLAINSANITFGIVIVETSINPDAAGGASNGALATPWSNIVTRGLQAKTGTVYNAAQPAAAADLAAFNQRDSVLLNARQTATGATATFHNIKNCASITRTNAGRYTIVPSIAFPTSGGNLIAGVQMQPVWPIANNQITWNVTVFSTTQIQVETFLSATYQDMPFCIRVEGWPVQADPIS
jgi:hypothetical protein